MNQEASGPETLRVLGVDPGTRYVGYGIVDLTGAQQARLIDCDVLRVEAESAPAKLELIFTHMRAQIEKHRPRVLAIEDIFYGKNFKSALKVGQARGVIMLAAQMAGLEIGEYSPRLVKKSVTGNGNADKSQVQRMVARILGRDELFESEDISDAIAVAFCHGRRAWTDRLMGGDRRTEEPSRSGSRSASRRRLDEQIRAARSSTPGQPRGATEEAELVRRLIRAGKAVTISSKAGSSKAGSSKARQRGKPSSD